VVDVINQTPPATSASKIPITEGTGAAEATATRAEGAKAKTAEDSDLETTLGDIDNMLLKMVEEEAAAAAVDTTIEKGKEQIKILWKRKTSISKIY
jgi:hypothetical protein